MSRGARQVLVIADDLSGAAEIGGVAWRRGLSASVVLAPLADGAGAPGAAEPDVLVLDSGTRSLDPPQASRAVTELLLVLQPKRFKYVFQKTDSVLRGHVALETAAVRAATGRARTLLVPANPSAGRIVRHGRYYVGGVPLDQTEFARDPEFPAWTADVVARLGGSESAQPTVLAPDAPLSGSGLLLGEAGSEGDLLAWAARVDRDTLPAGAAAFFEALLARWTSRAGDSFGSVPVSRRTLFVSGTLSDRGRRSMAAIEQARVQTVPVPEGLTSPDRQESARAAWIDATVRALAGGGAALVSPTNALPPTEIDPQMAPGLRETLVATAAGVLRRIQIDRLYVEGGSTASSLVRRCGWRRLMVIGAPGPGVVALRPDAFEAPVLIVKPGSYTWGPAPMEHAGAVSPEVT